MAKGATSYNESYTPEAGYVEWLLTSRTTGRAGMISGSRYQGRGTPLKGKGCPPPDFNYERFRPCKRIIPDAAYSNRDVLGQCNYWGHPAPTPKTTKRVTSDSFTTHLHGCRITNQKDVPAKKIRGYGDVNPGFLSTSDHIFGGYYEQTARSRPSTAPASQTSMITSRDLLPADVGRIPSWQSSGSAAYSTYSRPSTASGSRYGRKVDMARPGSSDDVIKYHLTAKGTTSFKDDPRVSLRVHSTQFSPQGVTSSFIDTRQAYRENLSKGRSATGIF